MFRPEQPILWQVFWLTPFQSAFPSYPPKPFSITEALAQVMAKEDLSEAFFNHRSFSTGDGEGVRQWQGCSEKYRDHSSGYCPGF